MENHTYRVLLDSSGTTSKVNTLELYVGSSNEVTPYRDIKEIHICVFGDDIQLDAHLDESEIDSLISFLNQCKEYIAKFNQNSKPRSGQL